MNDQKNAYDVRDRRGAFRADAALFMTRSPAGRKYATRHQGLGVSPSAAAPSTCSATVPDGTALPLPALDGFDSLSRAIPYVIVGARPSKALSCFLEFYVTRAAVPTSATTNKNTRVVTALGTTKPELSCAPYHADGARRAEAANIFIAGSRGSRTSPRRWQQACDAQGVHREEHVRSSCRARSRSAPSPPSICPLSGYARRHPLVG